MKRMVKYILFICLNVFATSCYGQGFVPFIHHGKTGYVNNYLDVVIAPTYIRGTVFEDGYAVVENAGMYEIIDIFGKCNFSVPVVEPYFQIDHLGGPYFAVENTEHGWDFININTMETVYHNSRRRYRFLDSEVGILAVDDMEKGHGYVDAKGNRLFSHLSLKRAFPFESGVAVIMDSDWDFGVINTSGELINSGYIRLGQFFSEGFCPAIFENGKSGYIDISGELAFEVPIVLSNEISFESTEFENNRTIIKSVDHPGFYSVIDEKGGYITKFIRADHCWSFSEGVSLTHVYNQGDQSYGYVNNRGEVIFDYIFSQAEDYHNGYARVVYKGRDAIVNKKGEIFFSEDILNN